MRTIIALGLLPLLIFGGHEPALTQAQAPNTAVNKLMLEKLQSSQKVLEGLAIGDFTKIGTNAEKLLRLSNTEEWLVLRTPRYEVHSNEFRRSAEALILKAKNKNLDGATLAFFDMTMSCVRCHQYVREVRDARLPVEPRAFAAFTVGKDPLP